MNLEMEGGTEALAAAGRGRAARASSSRQPYDELDIAVIRALQGPMDGRRPALRRGRRRGSGIEHRRAARAPARRWSSASSCAASPRSSSTAAPASRANGMGVWQVPEDQIVEIGAADGRGPRDLPLLPAPDLRGLALLASSRWPTAARRRSATRSSTRSPTSTTCTATTAPTLYSSTEFKKIRLHYFTDDYAAWEARARRRLTARRLARDDPLGRALRARAAASCPAASTRRCGRCARSAATRSSSSAARAPSSSTSTATATSTGSARGAR